VIVVKRMKSPNNEGPPQERSFNSARMTRMIERNELIWLIRKLGADSHHESLELEHFGNAVNPSNQQGRPIGSLLLAISQ
jgi:hypothetical protein